MNKFIMQPNTDCALSATIFLVHSSFIHCRKENELRSLHFIFTAKVIALTMTTEGTMIISFDHGLFQMNTRLYETWLSGCVIIDQQYGQ